MCTVSFNIPNEFLSSVSIKVEEASSYARLMFAVGIYLAGKVDAAYAASIAGVTTDAFLATVVSSDEEGLVGLYESDPRYQPITEEQLRQELLTSQDAYREGRFMNALEFCTQMERRHA